MVNAIDGQTAINTIHTLMMLPAPIEQMMPMITPLGPATIPGPSMAAPADPRLARHQQQRQPQQPTIKFEMHFVMINQELNYSYAEYYQRDECMFSGSLDQLTRPYLFECFLDHSKCPARTRLSLGFYVPREALGLNQESFLFNAIFIDVKQRIRVEL